ncbi:MAG: DNA polymerase IV, partial [Clostridia bacterium]|nr:DNA polymerase IV [Clostridia bacterium]
MRTILHSDLNNFYASCEQVLNPTLKGVAFAVCGSVEDRHGIILAKSQLAKEMGVKTAMTIKAAKDLCPDLVLVRARLDLYVEFSEKVRQIYLEFTDHVEPFGIDE